MRAKRGSQKWIQIAVNERPDVLERAMKAAGAIGTGASASWVSPLADKYTEYRDGEFLQKLNVTLKKRPLSSFWPARGPVWDGLALSSTGDVLLVEAKAHIAEMVSPASQASAPSLAKIERALEETRLAVAPKSIAKWSGTFYQLTNRLSHLYLLRTLNGVPARLVYVYFVGDEDVGGPTTRHEWEGAIRVTEAYLGLGRNKLSKYIHHVFVDVADLTG